MSLRKNKILLCLILSLALAAVFLTYTNVDNSITKTDKIYIHKILAESHIENYARGKQFEHQIRFIQAVQKAVLHTTPLKKGIPYYQSREPKNLYLLHQGNCFDRSRAIEKILRANGFKTLHIALYSTAKTKSKLLSLVTRRVGSHALSEVLTSKGWLIVDPNDPWISLNKYNTPMNIDALQKNAGHNKILWPKELYPHMNKIYRHPFTYVVGLYSRTGKFYPPFLTPFPNINWREFLYNFTH